MQNRLRMFDITPRYPTNLLCQLIIINNHIRAKRVISNYNPLVEVVDAKPKFYTPALYSKYVEDHKQFEQNLALYLILKQVNKLLRPINQQRQRPWTQKEWQVTGLELGEKLVDLMQCVCAKMNAMSKTGNLIDPIRLALDFGNHFHTPTRDGYVPIDSAIQKRYRAINQFGSYRSQVIEMIRVFIGDKIHAKGPSSEKYIRKSKAFIMGLMLNASHQQDGFCDELSSAAIVHIFNEGIIFKIRNLVQIAIDDKNADDVSHTFLAINLETNVLKDFSKWNEDAIIFDPWHNLICYAKDYPSLNKTYVNLHSPGTWTSVAFTKDDISFYQTVCEYIASLNHQVNTDSVKLTAKHQKRFSL